VATTSAALTLKLLERGLQLLHSHVPEVADRSQALAGQVLLHSVGAQAGGGEPRHRRVAQVLAAALRLQHARHPLHLLILL
jgi:hypothetical protein